MRPLPQATYKSYRRVALEYLSSGPCASDTAFVDLTETRQDGRRRLNENVAKPTPHLVTSNFPSIPFALTDMATIEERICGFNMVD